MYRENTRNKGFSIVEIIVVIAILAVLMGASVFMLGVVPQRSVRSCAEKIVSQLESARTSAVSYEDASLVIYRTADGVYAQRKEKKGDEWQSSVTKIGEPSVTVSYILDPAAGYVELQTASADEAAVANKLEIRFVRSTGGFEKSIFSGAESPYACSAIKVSSNDDYEIEMKLSKVTGKISYD